MLKMKTRHLLTAVVLPALFAACTSDEFNDNTNVNLQGRALLSPDFSITIDDGNVDTRFSWNEGKFGWNAFTQNDKFSAGLVDQPDGSIVDKIQTNYIFSSADGSNYTTTSQMVEGTYFFYSYPGFEGVAKRDAVPFDLTSQTKIDLNNPAKTVEENQLFVSPLYKLDAEHANIKLPLYFVSYWSTAGIRIKNTSGESFKIRRITLKGTGGTFDVKGVIDQSKIGDVLMYEWNEETGEYALPEGKDNKDLKTLDIAVDDASKQSDAAITVDCQAYVLENGKDVTAYIQVPYASLASATVDITVEVVESGITTLKTVTANVVPNEAEETNPVVFKRGNTMPVFGIKDGGLAAYEINNIILAGASTATGAYADSYEAFYEIFMAAANGEVNINNLGSLKVDDRVMYLLNNIAAKNVKFQNKIDITSENAATLNRVEFAEGATVTKGNITLGDYVKLPANKILTIDEGAKVTIGVGSNSEYNVATSKIVNNGTLTLGKADLNIAQIENGVNSEVVIAEDQTINTGEIVAFNAPKSLTINKGKTLTVTTPALTIGYGKSVTNNGTIAPANATMFVNNGTVINHGTISNGKNANAASQQIAKIDNYGTITAITFDAANGNSLITMKSADAEIKTVTTGVGDIDNTIGGYITTGASAVIFAKYTTDQSGELGKVMGCNKVIVENCKWTNPALPTGVTTLEMDKVTMAGTALVENSAVTSLTMTNCIVPEAISFTVATTAVLDYSTFNGEVKLENASFTTLNLKGVTFNGKVTASNVTAINIKASEDQNVANTTTTINAKVATGSVDAMNIAVKSTLDVTMDGEIGTAGTTSITNSGAVNNRGKIGNDDATPTGNWKGNNPVNS